MPSNSAGVNIRIELGKMDSEARGTDLDRVELSGRGGLQALRVTGREGHADTIAQAQDDAAATPIVVGIDGCRTGLP